LFLVSESDQRGKITEYASQGPDKRRLRIRPDSEGRHVDRRPYDAVWGAFTRFTLVSRAFGPGSEAGLGLSVGSWWSSRTAPHGSWPFEVEQKELRLGPASPQSVLAESGHSSPRWGSPRPQELAALQDTRSTGRISISPPLRRDGGIRGDRYREA
jgi:hypothetical protein